MKKFIPFILLFIGILVIGGVFVVNKIKSGKGEGVDEEVALKEVALEKRPILSLIPTSDGHWLKLKLEKIEIDAKSVDYELLYKLADGRTQGVPGTVKLTGQSEIERELLLGSESSGKYRFDEGVEGGTLSIKFRDEKGRLVAKFTSEFKMSTDDDELTSVDGEFKFSLDEKTDDYFIVIEVVGIYESLPGTISSGPFGIFSSSTSEVSGKVNMSGNDIYWWNGKWEKLEEDKASDIGIFVAI